MRSAGATALRSQLRKVRGSPAALAFAVVVPALAMLLAMAIVPSDTLSPSVHAGPTSDWPMFHYDAARSGHNANEIVLQPSLRPRWTYPVPAGSIGTAPTVVNGVAYVGSNDGNVYALDSESGALKWKASGSNGNSSPAVSGELVYSGGNGKVYALDAQTGAESWSYPTGGAVASSPVVVNGVLFTGSADGKVYALDAASGSFKWSFSTGGLIDRSSPAVADNTLYIGSSDGKVYALSTTDGSLVWARQTGGGVHRSTPAVANGVVYVGSYDKSIYALNARTGVVLWAHATDGAVDSSPAVASGLVFAGSYDGKLYALDALSGSVRWTYAIGGVASAPMIANGLVYAGAALEGTTAHMAVVALDASTGERRWSYVLAGSGLCGPALPSAANGMLFVGACVASADGQSPSGGKVYTFENETAPTTPPTPTPPVPSAPTSTPPPAPAYTPTPTATPAIPHVALLNVPSRSQVYPGESLAYAVLLDNSGTVSVTVSLTDTLPSHTSYITGTLPVGSVYSDTSRSITWSGTVPPASSGLQSPAFIFRLTVDENITATAITNTVSVSDGTTTVSSAAATGVSWRRYFPVVMRASSGW